MSNYNYFYKEYILIYAYFLTVQIKLILPIAKSILGFKTFSLTLQLNKY